MSTETSAPTPAAELETTTPSQPEVTILTPGVKVGREVWWWRKQRDDYTPPAMLENHPHRGQLNWLGNQAAATLILDQVVAVLQATEPIPADQEAEAIAKIDEMRALHIFERHWGWEVADAHEPLAMYWSSVRWGPKEHRVGAWVRYATGGYPEGFAEASPEPTFWTDLDLESIWYAKKQTGETSPIGTYENHPYGPHLDLIDGKMDQFPHLVKSDYIVEFPLAREYYLQWAFQTIAAEVAYEINKIENAQLGDPRDEELIYSFMQTAGWEIIDPEEPVLRFWAQLSGRSLENEYRIGFTVRYEDYPEEGPPIPYQLQDIEITDAGGYPVQEFLKSPPIHLDKYILQRVE